MRDVEITYLVIFSPEYMKTSVVSEEFVNKFFVI